MSLEFNKITKQYKSIISSYRIMRFEQAGTSLKLRAVVEFTDASILHIRETVINGIKRKYAYHWQDKNENTIIRWDNAPDWDVITFPHHKHIGMENRIEPSYERNIEQILTLISENISTCDFCTRS